VSTIVTHQTNKFKQNQTNQNPIKVRTNNIIDIPYTTLLENNQEPKNDIPTKQIKFFVMHMLLRFN
jgi:hypothetical protein